MSSMQSNAQSNAIDSNQDLVISPTQPIQVNIHVLIKNILYVVTYDIN